MPESLQPDVRPLDHLGAHLGLVRDAGRGLFRRVRDLGEASVIGSGVLETAIRLQHVSAMVRQLSRGEQLPTFATCTRVRALWSYAGKTR